MKVVKRTICSVIICISLMTNLAYAMPNVAWEDLPGKHQQTIQIMGREVLCYQLD